MFSSLPRISSQLHLSSSWLGTLQFRLQFIVDFTVNVEGVGHVCRDLGIELDGE
ncbi:hypothetical protein CIPAW_07G236900 [Carya illinoinensis]|uniref:Uncharacterized protein n=1 Tax=Carya illinoinensis TaxID=32201 RepID=A0A8T1PZQ8_CARIL|nr:hypothetical protein CIPAW_07G236900 [Carya illinoinensis]